MDVCQLKKEWCVKCGTHPEGQVCYEGAQIRRIKDLLVCPLQWTIERPPAKISAHIGN
jgi:hypothetical protein